MCGEGTLSNGVLHSHHYDEASDRHVLSFSTASSPTQLYTVEGADRKKVVKHTDERVLGIADKPPLAGRGRLVHQLRRPANIGPPLHARRGAWV